MPFFQVHMASGNSAVLEAWNATEAAFLALWKHGANDPMETVLEVIFLGEVQSNSFHGKGEVSASMS